MTNPRLLDAPQAIAERERLLLASLSDTLVVLVDGEQRVRFLQGRLFAGLDLEEKLGMPLAALVGAETASLLTDRIERVRGSACDADTLEYVWDGRTLAVDFTPYTTSDGALSGTLVRWHDITAVRAAERARDDARVSFEVAFDRAPIGMAIVGEDGSFRRVNDAMCQLTGFSAERLLSFKPFETVYPEDLELARGALGELGHSTDTVTVEFRVIHADGHVLWTQVQVNVVRDDAGRPLHAISQIYDVTERRAREERLQHLADHDPLTGLLNRRAFEVALNAQLAHCRRYGPSGAVMLLDLDGFKSVNDTYGHASGDELIIDCASVLVGRLRETDVVARLGGDEFAVLLRAEAASEAEAVAAALVETVRACRVSAAGSRAGHVTVSIGVAAFTAERLTAAEMLINADVAMYDAKAAGRDRYQVFCGPGRDAPRLRARVTWLERVERALEQDRFTLYAQPVVDLSSGEVVEHEVLVRMLGEGGDLIRPVSFLPVAARFGIICELDRWIVTRAIRAMAAERTAGRALPLSVNVAADSAGDPALPETIARELARCQVPPGELTLEVAEAAALADVPRARRFAATLGEIGCRFALDNFGAGLGSFYYLKHLPFDAVKIDGEFISHCVDNPADRLVVKAVCEVARGLGKQTVAEFVSNQQTLDLLRRHRVDRAQGYFLGRPRPLGQVAVSLSSAPVGTAAARS